MSSRPIFVATHPRACSTAFERVFMTRHETLQCFHEPFGEAFYYGPERMSERYANDETARINSGHAETTYKKTMDELLNTAQKGKRLFIKDMAQYLVPSDGKPSSIAPSFVKQTTNGTSETDNPSVVPTELLRKFHFTFLIRHPSRAIPSYYRCTIEPLVDRTGFPNFMPNEAGYEELRRLFDYLKSQGHVGPSQAGQSNGLHEGQVSITVIDADDLLEKPSEVIEAYCKEVGLPYTPDMLRWEDEENQKYAEEAFQKWEGFHDDVLNSTYLKPKEHKTTTKPGTDVEDAQWVKKYGQEAQKVIRQTVDDSLPHYEYLKSFALQI